MVCATQNYEKFHIVERLNETQYKDVRDLNLAIHDCSSIQQLAEVTARGVSDLYGVNEFRWLEIEQAQNRLLWSCAYSETYKRLSIGNIADEHASLSELKYALRSEVTQGAENFLLLSEETNNEVLSCTPSFRQHMQNCGLKELVNLQVYDREEGKVFLSLGFKKSVLSKEIKNELKYLSENIRVAVKKISRQASCMNMIRALQGTRKENCLAGISVLSSDGAKLWDVDSTTATLLTRSGAAVKSEAGWVMSEALQEWIKQIMNSHVRITARENTYTYVFTKEKERITATVFLECAGRGGIMTLISDRVSPQIAVGTENMELFTRRERQIANLMLNNDTSIEIAEVLNISKRTVEKHLENIYLKLGVKNRLTAIKKLKE